MAAERRPLQGRHVLVTAGGTQEPIDPVRFIGNRASGRMGYALARAALGLGARVTLVTTVPAPDFDEGLEVVGAPTAAEMKDAVHHAFARTDILLMAAAVADYRVAKPSVQKLKKSGQSLTIELVPTVDILASLQTHPRRDDVLVVGFAAETENLIANAQDKLQRKKLDLIVANDVSQSDSGIGSLYNAGFIIDASGVVLELPRQTKVEMAEKILDFIAGRLQ